MGFTHVTTLANRNCSFRSDTISKVLRDQTAYNILCVRFTSLVHVCPSHPWPATPLRQRRNTR